MKDRFANVMMKSAPTPMAILDHGLGARVWDVDGREYLDFLAGIAVNALGHAHPVFVDAVSGQAAMLAHVSNYFATEPQIELAERLTRLSGGDRVFFANSGAEAIEAGIKLARLTGRPRILSLEGSFHGRTMGSLSLTGKPALQAPFGPLLPGVEQIPGTIEELETALAAGDVAAVFVEPIKGEAGVVDLPAGYLAAARELTAAHGALLVLDEIQTGAGRTGEWFAFQAEQIVPDAIAVAKGIGGGFPIGALITFGRRATCSVPATTGPPSAATRWRPRRRTRCWARSSVRGWSAMRPDVVTSCGRRSRRSDRRSSPTSRAVACCWASACPRRSPSAWSPRPSAEG